MDENKLKHLEFIQNVITRLCTNSFQIKGLAVTIVAALLAFYITSQETKIILIPIIPTLIFWFLDTYYLQQERKYRGLYNDVAKISSVNKEIKEFEMQLDHYKKGRYSYFKILFSHTIWPIYLTLLLILLNMLFKS